MKQFSFFINEENAFTPETVGRMINALRHYESIVYLYHKERCADAKKIFRVLELDIQPDDCVYAIIRGCDEVAATLALRDVLTDLFCRSIEYCNRSMEEWCG